MNKIIIIGAGPAGLMAAIAAKTEMNEVVLIEQNDEIGKKLKITGGARCNITSRINIDDFYSNIVRNPKFMFSAFNTYGNEDLLDFFEKKNVRFKTEADFKVYPESDKATEIIYAIKRELDILGVKVVLNKRVTDLLIENETIKGIIFENGETLKGDKVIISTGGKSYPQTGSDGFMLEIIKKYGHGIEELVGGLVPLTINEEWVKNLQGISVKNVQITVNIKKKKLIKKGDLLFTHFGITGPVVLNLSSYINRTIKEGIELKLDLLPDISIEQISLRLKEEPLKLVSSVLKSFIPANSLKEILTEDLFNKKCKEINKKEEMEIINSIKNISLTSNGTRNLKDAIITSGGVKTKEINASTMESKLIKNLYFAGEIIDVDAITGGFNLQIAFSSGYLAGISAAN